MAKISKFALGLTAVLLTALAAGCGGSGGGSNGSSAASSSAPASSVSPPTVSVPTVAGSGGGRFTAAEWTQYQADADSFKQVNTATLTRVSACSKPAATAQHTGALQKCVGDSLAKLAAATTKLGTDLAGFARSATGSCASALGGLINYVRPYQASIASLQNTIAMSNFAAAYSSVSSLKTARSAGQQANAAVVKACAPA